MEKRIEFYMTAGIAADMDVDKHFAGAIGHIIHRFLTDDWGILCEEDCKLNEQAKKKAVALWARTTRSAAECTSSPTMRLQTHRSQQSCTRTNTKGAKSCKSPL